MLKIVKIHNTLEKVSIFGEDNFDFVSLALDGENCMFEFLIFLMSIFIHLGINQLHAKIMDTSCSLC